MIRRTQSLTDTSHGLRLKQLYYFRELLKNYDLAIVRQFLNQHIHTIVIKDQQQFTFQESFVYVAGGNWDVSTLDSGIMIAMRLGYPVEQTCETIVHDEEVKLYRISKKAELVLKKLYFLNIPVLQRLKSSQKLNFLMKCRHLTLNFGSYVYRKGQEVTSLFYLISGQIKIVTKKKQKTVDLGTIQPDRIFGLYCIKHGKTIRELSTKSNQNKTQIIQLPKQELQIICQEKQISFLKMLENIKSELVVMNKFWALPIRKSVGFQEAKRAQETFTSRIRQFHKERNIKNKHIEDLVQSKSLVLKVKEINAKRKSKNKENSDHQKYAFDVSEQNMGRNKMIPLMSATSTPRLINFNNTMIRSFVGLTRSPSVRTFISRMSRRS